MNAQAALRQRLLVLGEATLALATLAAVLSLGRLFDGRPYVPKVVVTALAAHVIAVVCRRLRLGPGATLLVAAIGGLLVLTWVYQPGTTTYGLPTSRTLDHARSDLSDAWS